MTREFDYVIAGAGSAGSVLGGRLSEARKSVCVLEAGPADTSFYIRVPAGFTKTLFDPAITFQYLTEPVPALNGRRVPITQGRVIGGSSSINGMVFNRGQALDFDRWEQLGNRGWSYREVLPYFKRLETRVGPGDDRYRGRTGPLPVTSNDWQHPLCEAFIAGTRELGFPWNDDYNGKTQEGAGYYQRAIHKGRRVSAARAFLYPAQPRGVEVITHALVSRVVLEDKRAVGVEYLQPGRRTAEQIRAREAAAVVDESLRVHGVERLYVIDASVMPTVPSANTYAATLMIAEKGADLVLGRRPPQDSIAREPDGAANTPPARDTATA